MAVGAEQNQVLVSVVIMVAILMMNLKRDSLASPFTTTTPLTYMTSLTDQPPSYSRVGSQFLKRLL